MHPEIVDYRDDWPARFEEIAGKLRATLGPLAQRIDHIGSTSVPGLCAKDVIDVQVTVEVLDVTALTTPMQDAGYRSRPAIVEDHRPPGCSEDPDEWRKLYFDVEDGAIHVHIRQRGRANQRYPILFRDYLRAHPHAAEAYGRLKQRLAVLCDDTTTYADAKDPVCDIIMQSAEEWAARTDWRLEER